MNCVTGSHVLLNCLLFPLTPSLRWTSCQPLRETQIGIQRRRQPYWLRLSRNPLKYSRTPNVARVFAVSQSPKETVGKHGPCPPTSYLLPATDG